MWLKFFLEISAKGGMTAHMIDLCHSRESGNLSERNPH